jgi:F-type H+-transporting ATPase subunit gamma
MKSKSLNKLKQRIKFFNNFQKVTNSIALISSIKFSRSYQRIQNIIRNVFYFLGLINEIIKRHQIDLNKIVFKNKGKGKTLVIVVSSDRGLAGAFDQIIFKKTESLLEDLQRKEKKFYLGVIGRKGELYFKRKFNLYFSFTKFENILPENFAKELVGFLNNLIEEEIISEIYLIRSNLTSAGFNVEVLKIFPFDLDNLEKLMIEILPKIKEWETLRTKSRFKWNFSYILEPTPQVLITTLLTNVFFLILYALIIEAQASLEFTRTITMRKANETARELMNSEALRYNKLRQQKITEELLDLAR